jgi:phosphoribosyl-AMP cyclohydrolase
LKKTRFSTSVASDTANLFFIRFLMKALTQVRFNDKGLIPAIAQDFETGEVLMFAWIAARLVWGLYQQARYLEWLSRLQPE